VAPKGYRPAQGCFPEDIDNYTHKCYLNYKTKQNTQKKLKHTEHSTKIRKEVLNPTAGSHMGRFSAVPGSLIGRSLTSLFPWVTRGKIFIFLNLFSFTACVQKENHNAC